MNGELSHNLPDLFTSRNRIIRSDTMQPVLLRGVNRSGLEYTSPDAGGFLSAAGFTEDEVREMVLGWRSNIIRVPFNQDWALRGRAGRSAEEYLSSLDQVISWAAAFGAYTILDLQWLDADTVFGHTRDHNNVASPNHVAPTPDAGTIPLWRMMADRYGDEPAVLFDLFNEPHNRLPDDPLPIHLLAEDGQVVEADQSAVGPGEWTPWATRLIAEARDAGFRGLILVGGVDWAFDLSGILIDAPGIVYSAHIYSNRKPHTWKLALGASNDVPVFVGEWGGTDDDLKFGRKLAGRLRRDAVGWTAWGWVDYPQLIQPPRAPAFEPTAFGELVRDELSR